jgi:hypothetical protein
VQEFLFLFVALFLTFGLAFFAAGFLLLAALFLLFAAFGLLSACLAFGLAFCHGFAACAGGVGTHLALALAYAGGVGAGAGGQFAFGFTFGLLVAGGAVGTFGGVVVATAGCHTESDGSGYD